MPKFNTPTSSSTRSSREEKTRTYNSLGSLAHALTHHKGTRHSPAEHHTTSSIKSGINGGLCSMDRAYTRARSQRGPRTKLPCLWTDKGVWDVDMGGWEMGIEMEMGIWSGWLWAPTWQF